MELAEARESDAGPLLRLTNGNTDLPCLVDTPRQSTKKWYSTMKMMSTMPMKLQACYLVHTELTIVSHPSFRKWRAVSVERKDEDSRLLRTSHLETGIDSQS